MPGGNAIFHVPVVGVLAHRRTWPGDVGYDQIARALETAVGLPEVVGLLLEIDSAAGDTAGLLDLVDKVRAAGEKITIHAHVNERAEGPACVLATAAGHVSLTRTAIMGGVGALMRHVDFSARQRREGLSVTPVFAGARKNDFSHHEPLTKSALAAAEQRIKSLYHHLLQSLSRNRGLAESTVRLQESAVFLGADAVKAGLADRVATFDQALDRLTTAAGRAARSAATIQP